MAMEGVNALLKTSTDYHGLTAPDNNTEITHIGYADGTCLPIEDEPEQITALQDILNVFEKASGNQIKSAKSYIIWLGASKDSTDRKNGTKLLERSERYLGMMIAQYFDHNENWDRALASLP